MPDTNRFERTWTLDGTPYTFRVPSGQQMLQVQIAATALLNGSGDLYARAYAERIALLHVACVQPANAPFADLPAPQLDWLVSEVDAWMATFRHADLRDPEPVGDGGHERPPVSVSPDLLPAPV